MVTMFFGILIGFLLALGVCIPRIRELLLDAEYMQHEYDCLRKENDQNEQDAHHWCSYAGQLEDDLDRAGEKYDCLLDEYDMLMHSKKYWKAKARKSSRLWKEAASKYDWAMEAYYNLNQIANDKFGEDWIWG